MKKTMIALMFGLSLLKLSAGDKSKEPIEVVARAANGHGLLCRSQGKRVLFLSGTSRQMGTAQGELYRKLIPKMLDKIYVVGGLYTISKNDWFFTRMDEVFRRSTPYTPKRFIIECDAMSKAAGISCKDGRILNYFPEMFHCSGFAVRGSATKNGKLLHARVLDYMTDINLQKYATLMVYAPDNLNAWLSVSYVGFIGTVTAMNDKGVAIGEMGGRGEGHWDGIPMSFLLREIMEKASSVKDALRILREKKKTCEYYYIISDKTGDMVGVSAKPEGIELLLPGKQHPLLPKVPEDTVFISGGSRKKHLSDRLIKYHGKIDVPTMMKIIKSPVAMRSNMHDAIFAPMSLDIWFADATWTRKACDNPYARFNLRELLKFLKTEMRKPQHPLRKSAVRR